MCQSRKMNPRENWSFIRHFYFYSRGFALPQIDLYSRYGVTSNAGRPVCAELERRGQRDVGAVPVMTTVWTEGVCEEWNETKRWPAFLHFTTRVRRAHKGFSFVGAA